MRTDPVIRVGSAVSEVLGAADRIFAPLMVSIAAGPDGNPVENEDLREALNARLDEIEKQPIEVVAKTIFPAAIWRRVKEDRQELYRYYREYLPDYVAMAPKKNSHGLYFARLICFGPILKPGNRLYLTRRGVIRR